MGAVNTTYTFTATDTITSTKMNNIIDQTTMTPEAIIGNTLEVASGKLKVRAQGITSNEMATGSVTSNAILDGTIVNADINASAAIAGTKVSPNFGNQQVVSTSANSFRSISGEYGFFIRNDGDNSYFLLTDSGDQNGTFNSFRPILVDNSNGNVNIARSLYIKDNGTVSVGVTSARPVGSGAQAKLFSEVSGTTNIPLAIVANRGDSSGAVLALGKSRGTTDNSNTIVENGDNIGELRFSPADGTDLQSISASINCQVDGTPSSNNTPGRLIFSTTPVGSASPTERMRITDTGDVGIGKTPTTKLDVNGTVTATAFAGPLTGNVTGNSSTATTLQNARTIAISGDVTGTATSFNGSSNITIPVTIDNGAVTQAATNNMLVPSGAVMAFAMNTAPAGWLAANGASVNTSTYANLFAAIGYTYGGSGSSFNLPDLRGYFVRGHGTNGDGTASGAFGAKQADELKSHAHKITPTNTVYAYVNNASSFNIGGGFQPDGSTTPKYPDGNAYEGGAETRPKNIAMLYCIKI